MGSVLCVNAKATGRHVGPAGARRSHLARSTAILLLLVFICVAGNAYSAVYALIIGTDTYSSPDIRPLRYAEADARAVRDVLLRVTINGEAVLPDNTRMLLGSQATRDAIARSIKGWLTDVATTGDTVVVYFSGHGVQADDASGDEKDKLDELLCVTDSDTSDVNTFLSDDDLNRWLTAVAATTRLVILDSCHSGTGAKALYKDANGVREARIAPSRITQTTVAQQIQRERGIEDALQAEGFAVRRTSTASHFDHSKGFRQESPVIDFAACLPTQQAVELADLGHGLFTYYLLAALSGPASPDGSAVSLPDIHEYVSEHVRRIRPSQQPLLDGPDLGDFTIGRRMEPYRVSSVESDHITIGVGLADGAAVGATYEVLSSSAKGTAARPDLVRVVAAQPKSSRAVFVADPFPVEVGAAVRLHTTPAIRPELVLRVLSVKESGTPDDPRPRPLVDALTARLGRLPATRVAGPQESAGHVVLCLLEGEPGAYTASVQLGDARALTGGEAVQTTVSGTDTWEDAAEDLARGLAPQIRTAYTRKSLSLLENREPSFRIDLQPSSPTANVGDATHFELLATQDCHLLLINMATDGRLYVIYPNAFDSSRPVRAAEVFRLPDPQFWTRPWAITATAPPGIDVAKAVAFASRVSVEELLRETHIQGGRYTYSAEQSADVVYRLAGSLLGGRAAAEWTVATAMISVGDWIKDPYALSRDPLELNALE